MVFRSKECDSVAPSRVRRGGGDAAVSGLFEGATVAGGDAVDPDTEPDAVVSVAGPPLQATRRRAPMAQGRIVVRLIVGSRYSL